MLEGKELKLERMLLYCVAIKRGSGIGAVTEVISYLKPERKIYLKPAPKLNELKELKKLVKEGDILDKLNEEVAKLLIDEFHKEDEALEYNSGVYGDFIERYDKMHSFILTRDLLKRVLKGIGYRGKFESFLRAYSGSRGKIKFIKKNEFLNYIDEKIRRG